MGALIWLASYPKSGNTWMRAFLHNLLQNPARPVPINSLDSMTLGDSQKAWYQACADRPLEQMGLEEILALTPQVHRRMMGAHPDSIFVKTHNFLGKIKGIPLITLDCTAGAIYIMRNPLDVAISLAHHFGMTIDQAIDMLNSPDAMTPEDDLNIPQFYQSWSDHVSSWCETPGHGLHIVRYEDMLEHPRKTFRGVAGFLGLNPPAERLRKAIKFSSFRVLQNQEKAGGFKEKAVNAERFFRAGRSGQWKKDLTPEQVERIVRAHGPLMEKYGYLP